jgi:lysyl-tRNA synthetase class 1
MHSSTGIVVTIQEMLDVVPPEVLRYLIIRNKPEKHIEFDPGLPLLSLVDEYDQRKGDERAIELSNPTKSGPFEIPFRHMVTAVQIARGDDDALFVALKRSGYDVVTRREEILGRARNVQTWLDKYAPPYVKFQVQETLPSAIKNLTPEERKGLGILAEQLGEKTAAEIHELVYAVAKGQGLDSKKFFQAIYLAFLGDRQGPKVGWFLASLERGFVRDRLLQAAAA